MISLHGKARYIGEAFEGERVGLHRHHSNHWHVYFGALLIGQLDAQGLAGIEATWLKRRRHLVPGSD